MRASMPMVLGALSKKDGRIRFNPVGTRQISVGSLITTEDITERKKMEQDQS